MNNSERKTSASYLARLEHFHQLDKEREDMIKDLIARNQDLEERLEKKSQEYEDEVQTRSLYQAQANDTNKQLVNIQHKIDANSFACAIIDGDGAVFRTDWIVKGEEGGTLAAHQLLTDMKSYLKSIYPGVNVESWHIVVQIFLNLEGLSGKLCNVQLSKNFNELPSFVRGFSRAQGLFSIINVGKGKEQADFKVRQALPLMVHNLHCKHVIFGPCHDKGYIVELRPFLLEKSISNRLTLLETTLPPRDFQELSFRRVKFTNVFRSELLPDGPPTVSPPLTPAKPTSFAPVSSSWSSAIPFIGKSSKGKASTVTPEKQKIPSTSHKSKYYLVNSSGQRIDEPLPPTDAISEERFRERCEMESRGPCNRYHLTGSCEEPSCTYFHGVRFGAGEQLLLKVKARSILCYRGSACKNPDCYWGHHCKYGVQRCSRLNCSFISTHDVDVTPTERVYEDGIRYKLSSERHVAIGT